MRNEDPEGEINTLRLCINSVIIRNGERNTLRLCINSVIIRGNEDPPCVHMGGGGRVTLYLDGLID